MTYLRLTLQMRTYPRGSLPEMRHPAQVAGFDCSKFERATADRMKGTAGDAVDAVVDDDGVGRVVRESGGDVGSEFDEGAFEGWSVCAGGVGVSA